MGKPLFCTVTLNPCLDVNCTAPALLFDDIVRIGERTVSPGGKGINVARFLAGMGDRALPAGVVAGANGGLLLDLLRKEGLGKFLSLRVKGETRENYNFFLRTGRS
jgi:fructose-1-phosphate kinase PfkB-like protein